MPHTMPARSSCRHTAQQVTGPTLSYGQDLQQHESPAIDSALTCLPTDTAAAVLAVDRSVYAALVSSVVTFIICNTAWLSQKHSQTAITSAPSANSSTYHKAPIGTQTHVDGQRADAPGDPKPTLLSPADPHNIGEEDVWQVARSGLLEGGPGLNGQSAPPKPSPKQCVTNHQTTSRISFVAHMVVFCSFDTNSVSVWLMCACVAV